MIYYKSRALRLLLAIWGRLLKIAPAAGVDGCGHAGTHPWHRWRPSPRHAWRHPCPKDPTLGPTYAP